MPRDSGSKFFVSRKPIERKFSFNGIGSTGTVVLEERVAVGATGKREIEYLGIKTRPAKVKKNAGVEGRWHDNRYTFITDLAESGEASDETIQDLAGHVSKQMLKVSDS